MNNETIMRLDIERVLTIKKQHCSFTFLGCLKELMNELFRITLIFAQDVRWSDCNVSCMSFIGNRLLIGEEEQYRTDKIL
jgi:hypothetical protein